MKRMPSVAAATRLLSRRSFAEYAKVELRELRAGTYRRKNLAPLDMELRLHLERLGEMASARGQRSRIGLLAAEVSDEIERIGLPQVYGSEIALCFLVDGAKRLHGRYGLAPAEAARLAYVGAEERGARAA